MSEPQRLLAFLVVLGVAAIALRAVSHRAHLPYSVVLAGGGILIGLLPGGHLYAVGPDLILLAFVPGLVFQAAFTLHLGQLRQLAGTIATLATIAVIAGVLVFAAAVHALLGLAWLDAMVLGAILAPTDPIAVIRLLRALRGPARITALLEGESLFNDGTAVALFAALVASAGAGPPSAADVTLRFLEISGIGLGIGCVLGGVGVLALRSTTDASLEFLTTLTLAYGSYLAADLAHGSGIVAVVTAATAIVVFRTRIRLHSERLLDFWEVTGFILNAILFLLIGTALPTGDVIDSIGMIAAAVAIHRDSLCNRAAGPRSVRLAWPAILLAGSSVHRLGRNARCALGGAGTRPPRRSALRHGRAGSRLRDCRVQPPASGQHAASGGARLRDPAGWRPLVGAPKRAMTSARELRRAQSPAVRDHANGAEPSPDAAVSTVVARW